MHKDHSLVVKSDKHNASVVLDWTDYHPKMMAILGDRSFQTISKDPTDRIEKAVTRFLKATNWPDTIKDAFIPRALVSLKIYGLPLIHTEGCPLHPIVNTTRSLVYLRTWQVSLNPL